MTQEKQEVLWEKLMELKETQGKVGETPEKRGRTRIYHIIDLADDVESMDADLGIGEN